MEELKNDFQERKRVVNADVTNGNIFFPNYTLQNYKYAYLCPIHTALHMVFTMDSHPDVLYFLTRKLSDADKKKEQKEQKVAVPQLLRQVYQDRHTYQAFSDFLDASEATDREPLLTTLISVGVVSEVDEILKQFLKALGSNLQQLFTFRNGQVLYAPSAHDSLENLIEHYDVLNTPDQKFAFFSTQSLMPVTHSTSKKRDKSTVFKAPMIWSMPDNTITIRFLGSVYFTGMDYATINHFITLLPRSDAKNRGTLSMTPKQIQPSRLTLLQGLIRELIF